MAIFKFFVVLLSSTRWVRSTLSSFCTVHSILSSAVPSMNLCDIERINLRERGESNLGQLGEKRERFLCAMPPPWRRQDVWSTPLPVRTQSYEMQQVCHFKIKNCLSNFWSTILFCWGKAIQVSVQWLWRSWQSGRFWHQRSVVRIPTSAIN